MPTIRRIRRIRRILCTGAIAAATLACAPAAAPAASVVSGCFAVGTVATSGVYTNLEYRSADGAWRWLGALARTNDSGCVTYRLSGSWRQVPVRIRATGAIASINALLAGTTPYYAPAGSRTYGLGWGRLRVFVVPVQPPTMTSSACLNHPSAAMLVACYMDRHGMHGNVISVDTDHDGYDDDVDRWPLDPTTW